MCVKVDISIIYWIFGTWYSPKWCAGGFLLPTSQICRRRVECSFYPRTSAVSSCDRLRKPERKPGRHSANSHANIALKILYLMEWYKKLCFCPFRGVYIYVLWVRTATLYIDIVCISISFMRWHDFGGKIFKETSSAKISNLLVCSRVRSFQ